MLNDRKYFSLASLASTVISQRQSNSSLDEDIDLIRSTWWKHRNQWQSATDLSENILFSHIFLPISYRSWISCLCRLLGRTITSPCGTSKAIFLKCTAQLINIGSANILIWVAIFSVLKRWRIKPIEIWGSNLLLTDMHEKPLSNLCEICGDNSQRKIIAFAVC